MPYKASKQIRDFPIDSPFPLDGENGQSLQVDSNGNLVWAPNASQALYGAIVGSTAQKNANIATHDNLQQAINDVSAGDVILILVGTHSGTNTINKKVALLGEGSGSIISGTITMQSGSDNSMIKYVTLNDNVTIDSGASKNIITDFWLAANKTITNNGTDTLVLGVQ